MDPSSDGSSALPSFACGMCGKCFSDAEQCRLHIQSHTGQQPFRCVICWPLFYDMSSNLPPGPSPIMSQQSAPATGSTSLQSESRISSMQTSEMPASLETTATSRLSGTSCVEAALPSISSSEIQPSSSHVSSADSPVVSSESQKVTYVGGIQHGTLLNKNQTKTSIEISEKDMVVAEKDTFVNSPCQEDATEPHALSLDLPTERSACVKAGDKADSAATSPDHVHTSVDTQSEDAHTEAEESLCKPLLQTSSVTGHNPASSAKEVSVSNAETHVNSSCNSSEGMSINPSHKYSFGDLPGCSDTQQTHLMGVMDQDASFDQNLKSSTTTYRISEEGVLHSPSSAYEQRPSSGHLNTEESLTDKGRRRKGKPKRLVGEVPIPPFLAERLRQEAAIYNDHMYSSKSSENIAETKNKQKSMESQANISDSDDSEADSRQQSRTSNRDVSQEPLMRVNPPVKTYTRKARPQEKEGGNVPHIKTAVQGKSCAKTQEVSSQNTQNKVSPPIHSKDATSTNESSVNFEGVIRFLKNFPVSSPPKMTTSGHYTPGKQTMSASEAASTAKPDSVTRIRTDERRPDQMALPTEESQIPGPSFPSNITAEAGRERRQKESAEERQVHAQQSSGEKNAVDPNKASTESTRVAPQAAASQGKNSCSQTTPVNKQSLSSGVVAEPVHNVCRRGRPSKASKKNVVSLNVEASTQVEEIAIVMGKAGGGNPKVQSKDKVHDCSIASRPISLAPAREGSDTGSTQLVCSGPNRGLPVQKVGMKEPAHQPTASVSGSTVNQHGTYITLPQHAKHVVVTKPTANTSSDVLTNPASDAATRNRAKIIIVTPSPSQGMSVVATVAADASTMSLPTGDTHTTRSHAPSITYMRTVLSSSREVTYVASSPPKAKSQFKDAEKMPSISSSSDKSPVTASSIIVSATSTSVVASSVTKTASTMTHIVSCPPPRGPKLLRTSSPARTDAEGSRSPARCGPGMRSDETAAGCPMISNFAKKDPYVSLEKIHESALKELQLGKSIYLNTYFQQNLSWFLSLAGSDCSSVEVVSEDSAQDLDEEDLSGTELADSDNTVLYGDNENMPESTWSPPRRQNGMSPRTSAWPSQSEKEAGPWRQSKSPNKDKDKNQTLQEQESEKYKELSPTKGSMSAMVRGKEKTSSNMSLRMGQVQVQRFSPRKSMLERGVFPQKRRDEVLEATVTHTSCKKTAGRKTIPMQKPAMHKSQRTQDTTVSNRSQPEAAHRDTKYLAAKQTQLPPNTHERFESEGTGEQVTVTNASAVDALVSDSRAYHNDYNSHTQKRQKKKRRPRVSAERYTVAFPESELALQELFTPGHKLRKRYDDVDGSQENDSKAHDSKGRDPAVDEIAFNDFDLPVRFAGDMRNLGAPSLSVSSFCHSLDPMANFPVTPSQPTKSTSEESQELLPMTSGRKYQQPSNAKITTKYCNASATVTRESLHITTGAPFDKDPISMTESRLADAQGRQSSQTSELSTSNTHETPGIVVKALQSSSQASMEYKDKKMHSTSAEMRKQNKTQCSQSQEITEIPSKISSPLIFTPSVAESVKRAERKRKSVMHIYPSLDLEMTTAKIAESISANVLSEIRQTEPNSPVLAVSATDVSPTSTTKASVYASDSTDSFTPFSPSGRFSHGKISQYICDKCGSKFKKHSNYLLHKKNQCKDRFHCEICGSSFGRKESLKIHMKIHTGEAAMDCTVCGKTLSTPQSHTTHMRIHTGEKPYLCPLCPKTFRQQPALTAHYRTHTKDKPFKCNICGKCYRFHKSLHDHKFTHTGERRFVCNICSAAYYQVSALNVHLRVHAGIRPHACHLCSMRFVQKSHLDKHMRHLHIDKLTKFAENEAKGAGKPFKCSRCGRGFTSLFSKRRHRQHFCMTLFPFTDE